MEEDTELEEGEALEGGTANFADMDDLDKRVESVLGHHQKDFEGSLHPDKLGPKFGGYGSFLPTHVRGDPSPAVVAQAPVRLPGRSRPAKGTTVEVRSSGTMVGAAFHRIAKMATMDTAKSSTKREHGNTSGRSLTTKRNDPVVDDLMRRSVYNGFGLDHSSSPSLDDDPNDEQLASEDEISPVSFVSPDSPDSPDRSPSYMIRMMTSYQPPHGVLLSPSLPPLLSEPFEHKEKPALIEQKKKTASAPSVSKSDTGSVATKIDGIIGKEGKSIKEKKEKMSERAKAKPLDPRVGVEQSDVKMAKKELENEKFGKEAAFTAPKTGQRGLKKEVARDQDIKFDKIDVDAGVDFRDGLERESGDNDWGSDFRKEKVVSSDFAKDNGTNPSFGLSRYVADGNDESKTLKDLVPKVSAKEKRKPVGSKDTSKVQIEDEAHQREDFNRQVKKKENGKLVGDGLFGEKLVTDGAVEAKKVGSESNRAYHLQKDVKERASEASKQTRRDAKRTSRKGGSGLRDNDDYGAEESKTFSKQAMGDFKGRPHDSEKEDVTNGGVKNGKVVKKLGRKVSKSSNKGREWEVDSMNNNSLQVGMGTAAQVPVAQPELFSAHRAPPNPEGAPPPLVVLENWVLCDKCEQWRLVPPGFEEDTMAEEITNWECRMMNWLPGMNDCKFTEDHTTHAVYELLGMQHPNNVQVNPGQQPQERIVSEPVADTLELQPKLGKFQKSSSKKKPGVNTPRLPAQRGKKTEMGSVKSKSLNDVGQHAADRGAGNRGVEIPVTVDEIDKSYMDNSRVMPEKRKLNDILPTKRKTGSEDDDIRPGKQARKFIQDSDVGQEGVHSGRGLTGTDMDKAVDVMWTESVGLEQGKKRKGKLLPSGSKSDSVGAKRKKKTESSEENEYLQPGKKSKVAESRDWKASRPLSQTSMASKVSFSAESSAFGSKRGSPVESTVSSSPVRSSRVVAREAVQDNNVIADASNSRARDEHYAMSNSREANDARKFGRNRNLRGDKAPLLEDSRDTRGGNSSVPLDRLGHRDERYREREDSVDRYHERENRYDRRTSRDDRSRDRDRDRDRDRSREARTADRGGEAREDQYSRERNMKQDRSGRPSSRESRLDKQGSLNGREEPKAARDMVREGRDRSEGETKHEGKPGDEEHPHENGLETFSDALKGDAGHRFENVDSGLHREAKAGLSRSLPPGQGFGWEGEKMGGLSTARRDSDGTAARVGQDSQSHVNSRSKTDGAPGSTGISRKAGLVNGGIGDSRVDRELKKSTDEEAFQKGGGAGSFGSIVGQIITSSSPSKKDHAVILGLIKEAREMKHKADRLSAVSNEGESTTLYLWSALKFLEAAHQQGMTASEGVRQAETARPMDLYNDTARLCDFCAEKYEKQRDLAAAALSYICAALARFRATVSKAQSLSKDCTELQNAASSAAASGSHALPALTPPRGAQTAVGESPSSSPASDLDNLNHHAFANDKGLADTPVKGTALPPGPGSSSGTADLIPQNLHTNFHRMLCTGLDVVAMVESWTKAHNAIRAAEAACTGNPRLSEGMVAVKKVGEIGFFGNMDSVVQHARSALDIIGH